MPSFKVLGTMVTAPAPGHSHTVTNKQRCKHRRTFHFLVCDFQVKMVSNKVEYNGQLIEKKSMYQNILRR